MFKNEFVIVPPNVSANQSVLCYNTKTKLKEKNVFLLLIICRQLKDTFILRKIENDMENIQNKLVVFLSKDIRIIWHEEEWFYSVVDIISALTDSPTPRQYWGKVKDREFVKLQLSPIWVRLKLLSPDGKMRQTDCVNTKGAFRVIQSIPSKKAEPFKLWLAQVGQDRLDEIENPELAQARMKEIYEQKGYPKDWIDKRLRGISIRQNLTDEWQARGIKDELDYAILTAEISKATFGMTPGEYKNF